MFLNSLKPGRIFKLTPSLDPADRGKLFVRMDNKCPSMQRSSLKPIRAADDANLIYVNELDTAILRLMEPNLEVEDVGAAYPIWTVWHTGQQWRNFVAIARGASDDIASRYELHGHKVEVTRCGPTIVPTGLSARKDELLAQKQKLEAALATTNNELKGMTFDLRH